MLPELAKLAPDLAAVLRCQPDRFSGIMRAMVERSGPGSADIAVSPEEVEATRGARGILHAATIVSASLMAAAALRGSLPGQAIPRTAVVLTFFAAALCVWRAGCWVEDRLLVGGVLPTAVARGNLAAAIAVAFHRIALGIIVSRAVYGDALGQLPAAVAFAAIGLVTWGLLVVLFRALTSYADGQQILDENSAAAVSYSGACLALAIIVGHALDGPFIGWGHSLHAYGLALCAALALYPVRQIGIGWGLFRHAPRLRGGELDRAVGQRRSLGAAAIEAAAYVGTAWVVTGIT